MSDIRDRFIRHIETPVAPTATGRPEDRVRETPSTGKRFYRPALPEGFGDDTDLSNAWTSVERHPGCPAQEGQCDLAIGAECWRCPDPGSKACVEKDRGEARR
jgi:hypothetical protein